MLGRLFIILLGLLGGAGVGQGPEIVTQYEQRLGGAVDELSKVISQFDADVAKNNLTREEALATYSASGEPFLQDRGNSMRLVINRLEDLERQIVDLASANEFYKLVYLVTRADNELLQGVMKDYSVGLPVTSGGLFYGGLGLLFGCLLAMALRGLLGAMCRSRPA